MYKQKTLNIYVKTNHYYYQTKTNETELNNKTSIEGDHRKQRRLDD